MTARRPDRGEDRIRSLYLWLLAAYPQSFRDRYQTDLLQAFDDRRTEPRFSGTLGGVRLVLFLLRDFVNSVPLARKPSMTGSRQRLKSSLRLSS